jgi:hypothetical protein
MIKRIVKMEFKEDKIDNFISFLSNENMMNSIK